MTPSDLEKQIQTYMRKNFYSVAMADAYQIAMRQTVESYIEGDINVEMAGKEIVRMAEMYLRPLAKSLAEQFDNAAIEAGQ
ncbi:hypothetical protein KC887_01270 [Candidatus Kaiserbacteria bacterium]|nr:hypothetical protein [Candidatus Kaiserbacteria bacterium]